MNEFEIVVENDYYQKLANGNICDIVSINDSKVRKYQVGNRLMVVSRETKEQFEIEIAGFLYFDKLSDAFDMVGKKYLGFSQNTPNTKLEDKFLASFEPQDVEKYGIVVISYKKI